MSIYKKNLQTRIEALKKDKELSEENIKTILLFVRACSVEGLGEHRIRKYISTLKQICLMMGGKDITTATKEDIENILIAIRERTNSEETRHDYLVTLKKYYRWLNGGEDPEITKFFSATKNKNRIKLPEDLLNESEVLAMIETTRNPKDRALIAVLWDTGARIGEVGTLLLKNIKFDEYGAEILVSGKTGMRRIRGVFSVPYLMRWLEIHPDKENPNAPLWWNDDPNPKKVTNSMGYASLMKQVKKAAETAGINKRIHAHLFRHSRATFMANHLTEAQMDAVFGWVQGSAMPSTYIHLSGRDVDKAILKAQGVEIDDSEQHKAHVQKCPRCSRINTPNTMFCVNCGAALNIQAVAEIEKERTEMTELRKEMEEMRKRTQLLTEMMEKLVKV